MLCWTGPHLDDQILYDGFPQVALWRDLLESYHCLGYQRITIHIVNIIVPNNSKEEFFLL